MVDRIIEAFTKPKLEITAVDEFIQCSTIIIAIVLIFVICSLVKIFIKNKKSTLK